MAANVCWTKFDFETYIAESDKIKRDAEAPEYAQKAFGDQRRRTVVCRHWLRGLCVSVAVWRGWGLGAEGGGGGGGGEQQ